MIEERYLAATMSTNLSDEAHKIMQVDVIKASGMSSRNIVAHYLRLISKPTRVDMERVYAALLWVAQDRKLQGGDEGIALALDWLMQQGCQTCSGAGAVIRKAVSYECRACAGMGKRKEPVNKDAQILIDYVIQCKNAHASRMFQKLR